MNEALAEQIAWYLDLNKREKQLSPHTIKAYHIDLKQFLSFVGGRAVEKEVLSQYIKHLIVVFLPYSQTKNCQCPRFLSGIGIQ